MKLSALLLSLCILSACQSLHSNDPSSLTFNIPYGSTLTLHKNLEIPAEHTHALIQAGKLVTEKGYSEYDVNCRFDVRKFGPRTVKPEVFNISRTEDGSEWFSYPVIMRFYTMVYLESAQGTDAIKLECQQWADGIDRNFTVAEIQAALGDYFSFTFPGKK